MANRKSILLLATGLWAMTLSACQVAEKNALVFEENSYNHFTYKGRDYVITNDKVDESSLAKSEQAFYDLKWVSDDGEKTSLAYNGLMRDDANQLVIGINKGYYLVKEKSDLNPQTILFEPEKTLAIAIDKTDCRLINIDKVPYVVLQDVISEDDLGAELAFLGEAKVFEESTGKELSAKDLSSLDLDGGQIENRLTWDYGFVYELKSAPSHYAIEINDNYYLLSPKGD